MPFSSLGGWLGSIDIFTTASHSPTIFSNCCCSAATAAIVGELEHGKRTLRLDRVNAVLAVLGKRVGVVDLERD